MLEFIYDYIVLNGQLCSNFKKLSTLITFLTYTLMSPFALYSI